MQTVSIMDNHIRKKPTYKAVLIVCIRFEKKLISHREASYRFTSIVLDKKLESFMITDLTDLKVINVFSTQNLETNVYQTDKIY